MVRHSRVVMGVCLVGVAAGFFAAPLWSRLMIDQSMVDVRDQAEKAPLVFRGRVLTVGPDPVEKRISLWSDGKPMNTNFVAKFQVDRIYRGKLEGEAVVAVVGDGPGCGPRKNAFRLRLPSCSFEGCRWAWLNSTYGCAGKVSQ